MALAVTPLSYLSHRSSRLGWSSLQGISEHSCTRSSLGLGEAQSPPSFRAYTHVIVLIAFPAGLSQKCQYGVGSSLGRSFTTLLNNLTVSKSSLRCLPFTRMSWNKNLLISRHNSSGSQNSISCSTQNGLEHKRPMALKELRNRLPHGEVGRIINSYIFPSHPDALAGIREYRSGLHTKASKEHQDFLFVCATAGLARKLLQDRDRNLEDILWENMDVILEKFHQGQLMGLPSFQPF